MKSICVYCGSSSRVNESYMRVAAELGALLAERGYRVIYGGANIGTMGALAEGAMAAGGQVYGVIPKGLVEKEVAHQGLTELYVVRDMHERKAKMAELADGFIALPGGLGTLEELFEMMTWAQLEFHAKPVAVLNINGFYSGLIEFLKHAAEEKFMTHQHVEMLLNSHDPEDLLAKIEAYEAVKQSKWWKEDEAH